LNLAPELLMVIMWRLTVTMGGRLTGVEGGSVTGLELIVAALAVGATAGITSGVQDAYAGLKGLLTRRLKGRTRAVEALKARETEPGVWQARIGDDLNASGAAGDQEVLAAARELLGLADPAGLRAGIYHVTTNHGAVGTFNAQVTFNNGPQFPPARPEAV